MNFKVRILEAQIYYIFNPILLGIGALNKIIPEPFATNFSDN